MAKTKIKNHASIPVTTAHKETVTPLIIKDVGHDRLLEALFFFWDGFERSSMNFFLTKDTAKQVIADQPLVGDRLTLGIRRMEWQGGQDRVFKAFMGHERIPVVATDKLLIYTYKDVPVYLSVYEENPCIQTLNIVFYNNDTFNVPTPFDVFCEQYE